MNVVAKESITLLLPDDSARLPLCSFLSWSALFSLIREEGGGEKRLPPPLQSRGQSGRRTRRRPPYTSSSSSLLFSHIGERSQQRERSLISFSLPPIRAYYAVSFPSTRYTRGRLRYLSTTTYIHM